MRQLLNIANGAAKSQINVSLTWLGLLACKSEDWNINGIFTLLEMLWFQKGNTCLIRLTVRPHSVRTIHPQGNHFQEDLNIQQQHPFWCFIQQLNFSQKTFKCHKMSSWVRSFFYPADPFRSLIYLDHKRNKCIALCALQDNTDPVKAFVKESIWVHFFLNLIS